MRSKTVEIVQADLARADHQRAVVDMIDAYCRDPMANGRPLDADVRAQLVPALRQQPLALILLAYDGQRPVGIACCFRGFSTFAAKPIMNLHDLMVVAEYRGRGVGRQLLQAVEDHAYAAGCCKVTLEVLEHNPARRLYLSCGYAPPHYENDAGQALFLTKDPARDPRTAATDT